MKSVATLFVSLLVFCFSSCSPATSVPAATSAYPPDYSELLKTYVTKDGVRYAAWHANKTDVERLKKVTEFFASTSPPTDRQASLAWHLNAYNAWILNNILARYPTKGPLEGGGNFFDEENIVISGKKTRFNDLEQKVIRPTFKEPRVHFALNCASASCPPLNSQPFAPATLNADLDRLARAFINGNAVQLSDGGKTLLLSKIFDWYASDFGGKGKLVEFLNVYRSAKLPGSPQMEFLDYDWSLNAAQ